MKYSKTALLCILSIILCTALLATTWVAKSDKQLVMEFPVIVTGSIVELDDNGNSATAHLAVKEILKNTSGSILQSGDFIEFTTCSPTSKKNPPGISGYTKGQKGIWFFKYDSEKMQYSVRYPYSLRPLEKIDAVKKEITLLSPERKEAPSLSIALVIPKTGKNRNITCYNENSHFHVVLTNNSDESIKLFQSWNSWGYFNLSFVIKDETGKEYNMKKKQRGWDKNAPTTFTLEPGDMHIIDVKYHGEEWEGAKFPYGKDIQRRRSRMIPYYNIKAVYQIREDEDSKRLEVWSGKIESEEMKVAVYR